MSSTAQQQSPSETRRPLSWQSEDVKRSALVRVLREIFHRVHEAKRCGGISRIEIGRDDSAGPSTDARNDCDVLLAVRAAIADRRRDYSRADLLFPKLFSISRVECLEPSIHRAVKHDVTACHQCAAP